MSSCLVTTEIFVNGADHRQEVSLASSMVMVEGSHILTDDRGWLPVPCGPSVACRATLSRDNLMVRDQCASGISAFSLSGDRPVYTCGTDCTTTGGIEATGNTWAARTAYYWADQATRKARRYVDERKIPRVRLETNHNAETHPSGAHSVCAGFWNDARSTIELFRSGGGCANTGENASIVAHEWGHALFAELYDPLATRPIDEMTNEAQADVHAALVTEDECIGRGVRPGERCAGCRESCNGLRDLGAFSLSGPSPATAATLFDRDGLDCPSGSGPLGAVPHCESLIASTAFMDLVELFRIRHGEATGVALAEGLFYDSLPHLTSAYQVVGGATDGCHAGSWYNALLAADDSRNGDGDLTNGTPNGCLIFQAFDGHDIACDVPLTDCLPWVGAGPDQETCVGTPVSIGPLHPPALDISWSNGAEGAPLLVVPSQAGLVTYTMEVSDASGSGSSHDTVDVRAHGCSESFSDNFDTGALATWETTGLWHHVTTGCPASHSPAMYFGLDECHYETCRSVFGDLISDVISVPATPVEGFQPALSFISQRGVEWHDRPITTDHTEVWIEEWPITPTSKADLRWARSSATVEPPCIPGIAPPLGCPSPGSWSQAEYALPISLQPYAGKQIRVRFHFDSLDAAHNRYPGWLIDNVEVGQVDVQRLSVGEPPTLQLISPTAGEVLSPCTCETFEISAVDDFGNDLSDQVVWSSDINGLLGSGRGMSIILSPTLPTGTLASPDDDRKPQHTITATVVDRAGVQTSIDFALKVPDDGQGCALLSLTAAELRRQCGGEGDR